MSTNVTATELRIAAALEELDASVAKLRGIVDSDPSVLTDPHLAAQAQLLLVKLANAADRSAVDVVERVQH